MDERKYTTLVEALAGVPDPRKARGQRHPWLLVLTLVSAALASGNHTGRAIGQWVGEHQDDLARDLGRTQRPLPSESTLRRALRSVDVGALEERLSLLSDGQRESSAVPTWEGVAVDGKEVRGARAHGRVVHLLSAVRHDGIVLKQTAVLSKSNEITGAPTLLKGLDLRGKVVTVDALLAQRTLARQIRAQHGHYLMVIKEDQPETYQAIKLLFEQPPESTTAAESTVRTTCKGHGRREWRTLETSTALQGWVNWPAHEQVLRRTCRRLILTTGEIQEETTYGITSLPPAAATAPLLEGLWRGHWIIENRVHYPRDVTFREDAGQASHGSTPQALAALRNALLNVLRSLGWTNIADALRHYGAKADRALHLIGALPARL
jgi:predicted transposase YbfD/YdcC